MIPLAAVAGIATGVAVLLAIRALSRASNTVDQILADLDLEEQQ